MPSCCQGSKAAIFWLSRSENACEQFSSVRIYRDFRNGSNVPMRQIQSGRAFRIGSIREFRKAIWPYRKELQFRSMKSRFRKLKISRNLLWTAKQRGFSGKLCSGTCRSDLMARRRAPHAISRRALTIGSFPLFTRVEGRCSRQQKDCGRVIFHFTGSETRVFPHQVRIQSCEAIRTSWVRRVS